MMNNDKLFEEQFSNPEFIGESGEGITIIDLNPPDPSSDVPIFVAPGWTETPEVFKRTLKHLFEHRRILLTVDHPRRGGPPLSELEHQIEELRKATNILSALEFKKIEKADFIAHSEGSINTTIAATIAPEQFEGIVYVNPAGMIKEVELLDALGRFMSHITDSFMKAKRDETVREQYRAKQKEALKYIAKNPFRAIKEGLAASTGEIHHLLQELNYDGINIGILVGDDDPLFPVEKIVHLVEEDHIDSFKVLAGGHDELHYRPDEYSEAILAILEEINEPDIQR